MRFLWTEFPAPGCGHRLGEMTEEDAMTEPDRVHTTESAEGDEPGDDETGGRTPHTEEAAEGEDTEES